MAGLVQPHNTTSPDNAGPIDVILTQEANRIGADIHKATLHTSPWIDLIKQGTFPEGMGYSLSTLIYDRALPLSPKNEVLGNADASPAGDAGAPGLDSSVDSLIISFELSSDFI